MSTIVVVSGGFDPIHSGHIQYFKEAKSLGDALIVALCSDLWLINKKGKYFMDWEERCSVISELKCVDKVIDFEDDEIGSSIDAIYKACNMFPEDKIIFANGGDRDAKNIPEMSIKSHKVDFAFGVGGNYKKNSSSTILERWSKINE